MSRISPECALLLLAVSCLTAAGQGLPDADAAATPTLRVETNLVLVPALVRTEKGQLVYTLEASDFRLTDDGVERSLTLEPDTDSQPLAMVIVAETGAAGAGRLDLYGRIGPFLDSLFGGVEHEAAVVSFDSKPALALDFTPNLEQVRGTMDHLQPGDDGDAIFDSLGYAVELLRKQPTRYRRAILLLSETLDHGSQMKLADALRAISDTNTAIYSMGFSTTRAELKHEAKGFSDPDDPGPAGGCMSRPRKDGQDDDDDPQPGAEIAPGPNPAGPKQQGRAAQAYDCASLLAPPLRAAKMLAIAALNGLHKNAAESVAQLTGGEYYKFENAKGFERGLFTISNHIPNRYVLSFHPQSPHPGLHALKLELKDYPRLQVTARKSYWVETPASP